MSMTTTEMVNQVFQRVFDDQSIRVRPEMTASDIDGWDSLSHVNLITALEARFDIRFTQKELLKQRNVGDLMAAIEQKLTEER
jgi:acyl carrier protein